MKDGSSDILDGAAVVGIFFDREMGGNEECPFLDTFFDAVIDGDDDKAYEIATGQFLNGLDFDRSWSYYGSLTTPPCYEGI